MSQPKHDVLRTSIEAASPLSGTVMIHPDEKVFHVKDNLYIGTEFGARDANIFDTIGFKAVINLTAGPSKVPNAFQEKGVEYLSMEIVDAPGANLRPVLDKTFETLSRWRQDNLCVLVHCSAGLSRSASVILGWLMQEGDGRSLHDAVQILTDARGRKLMVNPSFWMELAALERRTMHRPRGTPPSIDFTPWWIETFGAMGVSEEAVRRALHAGDWVDYEAASQELFD
jgi:protein-tyrosine phosphatase